MRYLRCLFLFAASCPIVIHADEKGDEWEVPASAASKLAAEVDLGWCSLRPPRGYQQTELGNASAYKRAGIKIAGWSRETKREVNPTMPVLRVPKPTQESSDPRELFEGVLDSLTSKWPDAKKSKTSVGQWNGQDAYRCQFRATSGATKLHGIMLAQVQDASSMFVVMTIHPVDSVAERNAAVTLGHSALSCKFKK